MADKITVKVTGIEDAISKLKKYQVIKRGAIEIALKETGFKIEASAKKDGNVPVQYGRLRASISTGISGKPSPGHKDKVNAPPGPKGLVVAVGSNVKYSHKMEFGVWGDAPKTGAGETSTPPKRGHKPRKLPSGGFQFLSKAYYKHEGEALSRIKKVMKKT